MKKRYAFGLFLFAAVAFLHAGEIILNEDNGSVSGTAGNITHDFPVIIQEFSVRIADPGTDGNRRVEVTIPVESISTNHERRDRHMFEQVLLQEAFPEIAYSAVTATEQPEPGPFLLDGNLTIQGVSKEYDIRGIIKKSSESLTAEAEFVVLMSDFGLKRPGFGPMKIYDEIKMRLILNYPLKSQSNSSSSSSRK